MKVWIPGGTGMLGAALAHTLKSRGHDVITSGRNVDVTSADAIASFVDANAPTHVVLCAAHTAVDACETDVERATQLNAFAPGLLGHVVKSRGLFAVHVSTDYVFNGTDSAPYLESAPRAPVSVYGKTKAEGEQRFLAACDGAVVRTSWLFGPHGKNFVTTMLGLMAQRPALRVVEDQHGCPTYTLDLADALANICASKGAGVWHYANSDATTWHAFATAIWHGARKRHMPIVCETVEAIPSSAYPTPAVRPAYSVLSTCKYADAFGAPRSWVAALDAYLDSLASTPR